MKRKTSHDRASRVNSQNLERLNTEGPSEQGPQPAEGRGRTCDDVLRVRQQNRDGPIERHKTVLDEMGHTCGPRNQPWL